MARTHGNPTFRVKKFGGVKVTLNLFSGTIGVSPKNGHLQLNAKDRNALVAWAWEWLNAYDALSPTASPMTLRDRLFGGQK